MINRIYNTIKYVNYVRSSGIKQDRPRKFFTLKHTTMYHDDRKNHFINFCTFPDCMNLTTKGKRLCEKHKCCKDDPSLYQVRICINDSITLQIFKQIIKSKGFCGYNINSIIKDLTSCEELRNVNFDCGYFDSNGQNHSEQEQKELYNIFFKSLSTYFNYIIERLLKTKQPAIPKINNITKLDMETDLTFSINSNISSSDYMFVNTSNVDSKYLFLLNENDLKQIILDMIEDYNTRRMSILKNLSAKDLLKNLIESYLG